jgi:hypothetical protein
MVDQEGLMLEPVAPTVLADLLMDPFSKLVLERGLLELGSIFLAATTGNSIHKNLVAGGERMMRQEWIKLQELPIPSREMWTRVDDP